MIHAISPKTRTRRRRASSTETRSRRRRASSPAEPQHRLDKPFVKSSRVASSLPTTKPQSQNAVNKTSKCREVDKCAVCLNGLNRESLLAQTPCGHVFHVTCLLGWRKIKESCPLCQQQTDTFNCVPAKYLLTKAGHVRRRQVAARMKPRQKKQTQKPCGKQKQPAPAVSEQKQPGVKVRSRSRVWLWCSGVDLVWQC